MKKKPRIVQVTLKIRTDARLSAVRTIAGFAEELLLEDLENSGWQAKRRAKPRCEEVGKR